MLLFVRFLLWILIAALPLQSGAVAFMSCGAELTQLSTSTTYLGDGMESPHVEMTHEHCEDSSAETGGLSHGKCSNCASCCVGAVAPPAVTVGPSLDSFSTAAVSAREPSMTAYISATLKRPPRRAA